MKKLMLSSPAATFAAGFFMAILLFGTYSFTTEIPGSSPVPNDTKISVQDANDMFQRYISTAKSLNEPLKGFSVSQAEVNAISALFKNSSVKACRVYMGKDQDKKAVRMIVGVDKTNTDLISAGIYQTSASFSSPCPSICDGASPITTR